MSTYAIEADKERATYAAILQQVEESTEDTFAGMARVARLFIATRPNPVYVDALVNRVMIKGHRLIHEITRSNAWGPVWVKLKTGEISLASIGTYTAGQATIGE